MPLDVSKENYLRKDKRNQCRLPNGQGDIISKLHLY